MKIFSQNIKDFFTKGTKQTVPENRKNYLASPKQDSIVDTEFFHSQNFADKESKIHFIGTGILIGFIISCLICYVSGAYLRLGYPYNTFLFNPRDAFNDFFNMYNLNVNRNPYFEPYFFHSNYYPFGNFIFYLFTFLNKGKAFSLYLVITIGSLIIINAKQLRAGGKIQIKDVIIFSLLSFPVLYTLDRGNIEGIIFPILYLFLYFNSKNDTFPSAIMLAIAISIKIYPAIFILLLISDKKYREIVLSVFFVIVLTITSLLLFENGFYANLNYVLSGFEINSNSFLMPYYMQQGVGLYSMIKMILIKAGLIEGMNLSLLLKIYFKLIIFLSFLLSAYVIFIEKTLWRKIALLSIAMILFPHISCEYKMINIFLPIYFFLDENRDHRHDLFFLILFVLMLIPNNYYFFSQIWSDSGHQDISISVMIQGIAMILMILTIVKDGIIRKYFINKRWQ